jgi:hypothetical protein
MTVRGARQEAERAGAHVPPARKVALSRGPAPGAQACGMATA